MTGSLTYDLDIPEGRRRAMHERAHELCRATNMRLFRKKWAVSDWSSFQSSVASAVLGLNPDPRHPGEDPDVTTVHDQWRTELGIVTASLNETINEFSDGPVLAQGDESGMRH